MTLDEAIKRMMTCATAVHCVREEACFMVVAEMKQRREYERLQEALRADSGPAVSEDHDVMHYAPHFPPVTSWECNIDWSAA